jgi:hypothetical protein
MAGDVQRGDADEIVPVSRAGADIVDGFVYVWRDEGWEEIHCESVREAGAGGAVDGGVRGGRRRGEVTEDGWESEKSEKERVLAPAKRED